MEDLWPDDLENVASTVIAPVVILKKQADAFSQRMKNLVEAKVVTEQRSLVDPEDEPAFGYGFCITAPGLGNYLYRAFSVEYGVEMYPCKLLLDTDIAKEMDAMTWLIGGKIVAKSEENLKEILRKVFNSSKIKQVIGALLQQVKA